MKFKMNALFAGVFFLALPGFAQVIFKKDSAQSFLFSDKRALKKGDLITVFIAENTTASQSANTAAKRDDKSNLSAGTGLLSFLTGWGITAKEDFKGEGSTKRTGTLVATLTVTIVDIKPNGTYVIEGKQEIGINREKQILTLKGEVRPVDVGPNNTVPSTKVANAQISLVAEGLIHKKQKRPWILRVLDHIF